MADTRPIPAKPTWMRNVLLAAALWNLVVGTWVVFYPTAVFDWLAIARPTYPELTQCLGMLIAVFGVAYATAAMDPLRHWPVIFAGLLAKLLGPAGFLYAAMLGRIPMRAGWTMLAGEILWWLPFAFILRGAYGLHLRRLRSVCPEVLSFALRARTSTGASIDQMSKVSPVLLVFLRHTGCTFCREAVADIARQRQRIESAGASIVLVHMGDDNCGSEFFSRYNLSGVAQISDPKATLYKAFGLPRGSLRMLFGPKVLWRGFQAGILKRHGVGALAGDGFQMPGLFLVFHGQILRSFRHQSVADRPDYARFVREMELSEAVF